MGLLSFKGVPTTHTLFYEKDEKIGYILLLAFKHVLLVNILFYYMLNMFLKSHDLELKR